MAGGFSFTACDELLTYCDEFLHDSYFIYDELAFATDLICKENKMVLYN